MSSLSFQFGERTALQRKRKDPGMRQPLLWSRGSVFDPEKKTVFGSVKCISYGLLPC